MSGKFLLFPQDGKVRVTSPFGMRNGSMHRGVDLASDNVGTDWNLAAADAVVTRSENQPSGAGYWLEAKVDHPILNKPAYIRYYHLKEPARFYERAGKPAVKVGDHIKQGEKIGIEGNTGASRGSHLHFEVRLGGNAKTNAVDPVPLLWVPKALPIDRGTLTQAQFKNVKYVEDFVEEDNDMTFKKGDKGAGVTACQNIFKTLGYDLGEYGTNKDGIDGLYGSTVEGVVKGFQEDNNLPGTGVIDEATLEKMAEKIVDKVAAGAKAMETAQSYAEKIVKL